MELIESTFSETSDGAEKIETVEKSAVIKSPQKSDKQENISDTQATGKLSEKEDAVKTSKEAPGASDEREDTLLTEQTGAADQETLPDKPAAIPNAKAPEMPARPPTIPRKNVIPQRRVSFEQSNRAPFKAQRNVPSADSNQQPPPDKATDQDRQERLAGIADFPTSASLPAATESASTHDHAADGSAFNPNASLESEAALEHAAASQLPEQETRIFTKAELAWADIDLLERSKRSKGINQHTSAIKTQKMPVPARPTQFIDAPTTPLPAFMPIKPLERGESRLTRGRAFLLLILLIMLLINATVAGFGQFFGPQGWGSVFNAPADSGQSLLTRISQQLQSSPTTGHGKATPASLTPAQIVNTILSGMTLDEKLGQMMMVQFTGQSYSPALDAMINQYKVGAVLYFQFNIGSKSQLTGLNSEMQSHAFLPLLVAVDQEGGTVDRLVNLDGAQPSASEIGATGDTNRAYQQGIKDAKNLASYGFNLNLAPVVDVNNVYNWQLAGRTYGSNPTTVSQMAEAYLKGLQHSGKVLGTLKHFPGLGDVSTDPHYGLPALTRPLNSLNSIDWAPYSNLIKQGNVYSVMVTHEIVNAVDRTQPSSLSPKVISILRNQMHFQGVIITDSLTMDSIHNFYTFGDAAARAVEAGDDILMGADSPGTLAQMLTGIKQAMSSGAISQQRIDDSVRRILLFKYEMGLLHI